MCRHNFFKLISNYLSAASILSFFAASSGTDAAYTTHLPKGMKDMVATWCKGKVNNAVNL